MKTRIFRAVVACGALGATVLLTGVVAVARVLYRRSEGPRINTWAPEVIEA